MTLFLVTFEIERPPSRFQITNDLMKLDAVQLAASTFVVNTDDDNGALFSRLKSHIDETDSLFVMTLDRSFSGLGLKTVIDWLNDRVEQPSVTTPAAPALPLVMNFAV